MRRRRSELLFLSVMLLLGGCATGNNTTLFVTKSNIGIDVDARPPTAEISIARRELVIAPAFESGQTPPVMASFKSDTNPFSRFFFGIQSTFAGGDAAVGLAQQQGTSSDGKDSVVCLSKEPDRKEVMGTDVSVSPPGKVRPFLFGTDTTFGLKLAWSGMTAQLPDTVRLGFNRKEFTWAPVFVTDQVDCTMPGTNIKGKYGVRMPPFLAVLNSNATVGTPSETGATWAQYFATGKAASTLANQGEVRGIMKERMAPYQTGIYDPDDPQVPCLEKWLNANPDRPKELQTWWTNEGLKGPAVLLIRNKQNKQLRAAFIKKEGIKCEE